MSERLQKYLARAGVASRRQAERLIEDGHVKVNGKVVRQLGTTVVANRDVVEFAGRRIELDSRRVYLLVYKPQKMITSVSDPEGRDVVVQLVPKDFGRVYPVGRLDWDSEGAVILTNDGDLTELLTHPRHEVPKTYMVKTTGIVQDFDPRIERLRDGVVLDDGYRTRPAELVRDSDTGRHSWFIVTIREGKNRQIRRMFEAVGLDVRRLRRIAYGPVLLGELQPGEFRRLNESEIEELFEAAGGKRDLTSASRGRLNASRRDGRVEVMREARRLLRVEETPHKLYNPRTRSSHEVVETPPEPAPSPPARGARGGAPGAERPARGESARGRAGERSGRGTERGERPTRGSDAPERSGRAAERGERPARGTKTPDRGARDGDAGGRPARGTKTPDRGARDGDAGGRPARGAQRSSRDDSRPANASPGTRAPRRKR